MKFKKLLAGVISATMVLGTMVMPAFASNTTVGTSADFKTELRSASTAIKLSNDITVESNNDVNLPDVYEITKDCVIDLDGHTLNLTAIRAIWTRANDVTIKNGKIVFGQVNDAILHLGKENGTLSLEDVVFEQSGTVNNTYFIALDFRNTTLNVDGCTMENISSGYGLICGNNTTGAIININNSKISAKDSRALFGGTFVLSGNTNISENIKTSSGTIYTIGDDVTLPNGTSSTTLAATVTTTAGATSYYSTFAAALAAANDGDTLDMCGNTVHATGLIIGKSITFQNGTFEFNDVEPTNGTAILWVYNENSSVSPAFKNVKFVGKDYCSGYGGVIYNNNRNFGGTVTLDKCTFTLENDKQDNYNGTYGNGVLGGNGLTDKFVVTDCAFNLTNTGRIFKVMTLDMKDTTITATSTTPYFNHAFRRVAGTMENCTITATGDWESAIKNVEGESLAIKGNSNVSLAGDIVLEGNSTITVADTASLSTTGTDGRVAKIGNVYYATFDAALAAAQAGDTITLVSDVTFTHTTTEALTNASVIELNRKILTLDGVDYNFGNITIQNGYIDVTTETAPSSQGIFCAWEGNESIVFDGVTITANKLNNELLSLISYGKGKVTLKNSTIKVTPETTTDFAAIIAADNNVAGVEIIDSTIEASNTKAKILLWGNVKISGDSTIRGNVLGEGMRFGGYAGDSLTITKTETGTPNIDITTPASRYGIYFSRGDVPYTVDDDIDVKATIYRPATAATLANTVKVSFADVTENEGEKVYDIFVEADSEKTINRLMSVQMALKFTTDDDIEMNVTAADGLSRSFENGMYLFNFDGETRPSATGTKIKIGQVKMTGYGTFTLVIDAEKDNKVHAAELNGENVVTDFVPEADEGQGRFDISANLEDVEVSVPTRKLTINVDFNNAVESQVAAYQDMTVTVTGPKGYEKVIKLGSDETMIDDNKVVITIENELTLNTTYTVEVKGAGYRTALYSVNMNADKTLNFWNNAKDTEVEVEVGKEASKKNTTFLAGELVKDGKINIYDLSAVVSYFGTTNNVAEQSDYAKYDLNRDGKIDSKDVAYVLVSWGK